MSVLQLLLCKTVIARGNFIHSSRVVFGRESLVALSLQRVSHGVDMGYQDENAKLKSNVFFFFAI